MRISTFKGDAGYVRWISHYEVSFNGRSVNGIFVLLADEQERILVSLKRDSDRNLVLKDGETITVIERGDVKITEAVPRPEEVPVG